MNRRLVLLVVFSCSIALARGAVAGEREPPPIDVIPAPREIHFGEPAFEIDDYAIIEVSAKATRGTRRAARAVQLGIRERFGLDLPIIRISEAPLYGPRRPIWVVEPRLRRPPANTIGVKGLSFTEEMGREGYFIRVDAIEAVVHGASGAGSYYGAQTLLQLIRPPRRGTLFRRRRGPTIPCLWLRDWPTSPTRTIYSTIKVPSDPQAAESFLRAAAHYKLNTLQRESLPDDKALATRLAEIARRYHIRIVEGKPVAHGPSDEWKRWGWKWPAARYPFAVIAEKAWGPPDPHPDTLRLRFARAIFGREAAAEALQIAERLKEMKQRLSRWYLSLEWRPLRDSTAQAKSLARDRAEHRRRARRVPSLWRRVRQRPALRDAFLADAELTICTIDCYFVLADAIRHYNHGRLADAVRALREQGRAIAAPEPKGEEVREFFDAMVARFEAAGKAPKLPPIHEVIGTLGDPYRVLRDETKKKRRPMTLRMRFPP